jgi:outer membrane protein assembly factor BamB
MNKYSSIKTGLLIGTIILLLSLMVAPIVIGDSFNEPDKATITNNYDCYQISNTYNNIESEKISKPIETTQQSDGPPIDSPWPMKCHDLHHTSQSQYSTADNTGLEKWRFRSEQYGTIESSAVIDNNGIIYFGTMGSDNKLYALYPNGTKKWSYPVGLMIWSAPAIDENGTIYIGSWDNYLHAVNPDGTRKWRFDAHDSVSSSPAIDENGIIYFGDTGGKIYALYPNGTVKWKYSAGFFISSDPAVGDDGTIYIGSYDDYLYALYPNGTLRWRFKTGNWVKGHPSIADDGTIYVTSRDGYLYALYPNGTLKWKVGTSGSIMPASAAIASDGTLYVGTDKLHAFYPNGTLIWSVKVGGDIYGTSPAISSDGTICVSAGKSLVAVNPDGTIKWREQISNMHARSSPCIGEDGTVYVGSSWENPSNHEWFGYLHAFGELDPGAPSAPDIDGTVNGRIKNEYEYSFVTTDPNGKDVYYYVEWGDGKYTNWLGPYSSGEELTLTYQWEKEGVYVIRAKARNADNLWSPWGTFEVTMSRNRAVINSLFLQFTDRFSFLERALFIINLFN